MPEGSSRNRSRIGEGAAAVVVALAIGPATGRAETIRVPQDQPTIQAGINAAAEARVESCTFRDNIACGGLRGTVTLRNCTNAAIVGCDIVGNTCDGITTVTSTGTRVINCTVAGNTGTGIVVASGDTLGVDNSIVWGNSADQIVPMPGATVWVRYSDVAGGFPGPGNQDADPRFVDPAGGDVHLGPGSPAIDAAANAALPADEHDLDGDGDGVERFPLDLDGGRRFADDEATGDTGCGGPVVADLGAYEFPGAAVERLAIGDANADGPVDFADLLAVLAAWGPCPPCCLADLDLSGAVDVRDLLAVLASWS